MIKPVYKDHLRETEKVVSGPCGPLQTSGLSSLVLEQKEEFTSHHYTKLTLIIK